jgi:two-component system, NarL family, response regulator DesR
MSSPDRTVALVGGAALTAEALAWVLSEQGHTVLGRYRTLAELELAIAATGEPPDVALLDVDDPLVGLPPLAPLRIAHPDLRIVVLCRGISPGVGRYAMTEALEGVVLKSSGPSELDLALRHALEGRAIMPAGWDLELGWTPEPELAGLSAREREVLDLAAAGLTNAQIASRLSISANTVKFHLRSIYARLGVRNRVEAVRALRGGPAPAPGEEKDETAGDGVLAPPAALAVGRSGERAA